jgi:hypothetical protein
MNRLIIATSALLAGSAVFAQSSPVTQPAPAAAVPPAPSAPMMHDRTMTRAEAVQMVRDHFGQMDTNKDGSITTAEIDEIHANRMKDFDKYKGRGHAMTMGDPSAAFDRLDTDKNGSISREEFGKAHEERVERRVVVREERQRAREGAKDGKEARRAMRMHGMGGMGGRMIVMADSNRDGRITLAEAETMALQHFDQLDTNRDGQVTPEERRAGRKMMSKHKAVQKSGS